MIHILDDNALCVLASIEGDAWKREQQRDERQSWPNRFYSIRNAVREATQLVNDPRYADCTMRGLAADIASSLVLYGAGGWQRYSIDDNGFIVPLAESFSSAEKLAAAREALMLTA